jgi:hypothetical protein
MLVYLVASSMGVIYLSYMRYSFAFYFFVHNLVMSYDPPSGILILVTDMTNVFQVKNLLNHYL